MPAANHNFTIEQGSAFEIVFEFINNNNNPIDLTNWCALLQWIDNEDNTEIFNTNYEGDSYRMFVDSLGKITLQIQEKYYEVVRGKHNKYFDWLTFVR